MANANPNMPFGATPRRGRPPTYTSTQQRREEANFRRRELRRNRRNNDASVSETVEDAHFVTNNRRGRPPTYASAQERREAYNAQRRARRRIQQNFAASIPQTENAVPMPSQQHRLDRSETRASQSVGAQRLSSPTMATGTTESLDTTCQAVKQNHKPPKQEPSSPKEALTVPVSQKKPQAHVRPSSSPNPLIKAEEGTACVD